MSFGIPVTAGTKIADIGPGYIVRFDLSNRHPSRIYMIQAADTNDTPDDFSPVSVTEEAEGDLMDLIENPGETKIAFATNLPTVDVYLNGDDFPFNGATEILIKFYRDAIVPTDETDHADIPRAARRLALLYLRRSMRELAGKSIPDQLVEQILDERTKLGLV